MKPAKQITAIALTGAITLGLTACKKEAATTNAVSSAAQATYVAPGAKDEYYLFYSGGHSGQIYVAGIPSMRHISTIPVFAPYSGTGYGYDEESKKMLGDYTWGGAFGTYFWVDPKEDMAVVYMAATPNAVGTYSRMVRNLTLQAIVD